MYYILSRQKIDKNFCPSRIPRKKKGKSWILSERRRCLRFAPANETTDNSDLSPVDPPVSPALLRSLANLGARQKRSAGEKTHQIKETTKKQNYKLKSRMPRIHFQKKVQSLINRLDRSSPVHQRVGDRSLAGQRQRPAGKAPGRLSVFSISSFLFPFLTL